MMTPAEKANENAKMRAEAEALLARPAEEDQTQPQTWPVGVRGTIVPFYTEEAALDFVADHPEAFMIQVAPTEQPTKKDGQDAAPIPAD